MANHISHAALPYPIRKARYTLLVPFVDSSGTPTDPVTPDTEVSKDGAAFADCAEEITTITGSNGEGYITLTGAETDCSALGLAAKVASGPKATLGRLYPRDLVIVGSGTLSAGAAGGGTFGTLLPYELTGCFIRTTGGTGGGGTGGANNQARKIMTHNVLTGGFTVGQNWETTPDATTTYDVLLPEGKTLSMLKTFAPDRFNNGRRLPQLGIADYGTASAFATNVITLQSGHGYSDNTANGKVVVFWGTSTGTEPQAASVASSSGDAFTLDRTPTEIPTGTLSYVMFDAAPNASLATALATIAKLDTMIQGSGPYSLTSAALVGAPGGVDPLIVTNGTAYDGSSTSLIATALYNLGANKLVGCELLIDSGAGSGEAVYITSYTPNAGGGRGSVSFFPALSGSAAITIGNTFRVRRRAPVRLAGINHGAATTDDLAAVRARTDLLPAIANGLEGGLPVLNSNLRVGADVSDKTNFSLSAAGIDAILDRNIAEPTQVFTWPGSLRAIVAFQGVLSRNKSITSETGVVLRNSTDTITIASAAHALVSGVLTRSAYA